MALARRLALSSWPPLLVTAAVLVGIALRVQLPATDLARYLAYLAVGVTLPGTIAWRGLLHGVLTRDERESSWFQDLSLGTVFGFAIQLPVYLIGVAVGVPLLLWAVPVLTVATLALPRARRAWGGPRGRLHPASAWLMSGTILYGAVWMASYRIAHRPLSLPHNQAHFDETFHQALTAEVMHRVPPSIPWVSGEPMNYHWFVHAQLAATRWGTDLHTIEQLRVTLPLTMVTLTVLALGAVVLHLTQRHAAAAVAPALLVFGVFHVLGPHYRSGVFLEPYLTSRLASSPSFSYGILMSLPVFLLVAEVLRRRTSPVTWRGWLAMAVVLLAAGGSKGTIMPVLVCAGIGTWVMLAVFTRRVWNPAAPLTLLTLACTAFIQIVVFGGRSPGLVLNPFQLVEAGLRTNQIPHTTLAWAAMLGTMLVAWLLYATGAVGLARERGWTHPGAIWMAIAVVTGLTVPFVLYRQGWSVLWFSKAMAPVVVILGAWGLAALLPRPLRPRTALALLAVALGTALVALGISNHVEEVSTEPEGKATVLGLLLTCAVPLTIVLLALVLRLLARLVPRVPRLPLVVPVAMLLGLTLVNPLAFADDWLDGRDFADPARGQLFAEGGAPTAQWVARNSDPDDLVATNAHCMRPNKDSCDNRHFWIAAHTERQVLLEGWGYTGQSNDLSDDGTGLFRTPTPFPDRLEASDAAFEQPSADTIGHLADEYGVDWLFVDKRYDVDMDGLRALEGTVVEKKSERDHYAVFRVLDRR